MFAFTRYNNVGVVLSRLLKKLKTGVSPDAVISKLEKHPDYPNVVAVSDVLSYFHVKNSMFRLEADDLSTVPVPFIAHTRVNGGEMVLIDRVENGGLLFSNGKGNRQKTTLAAFRKIFDGVVLTAEAAVNDAPAKSGESVGIRLRTPLTVTGVLLLFITAIMLHTACFTNFTWQLLALSVLKTAGLVTCTHLLMQSIDRNSPLIQKIGQSGCKTNCDGVLSSNSATIFKGLSWSEVGFFYFAGTWLVLSWENHSVASLRGLAILNLISLPYTFYSVYYQARIAKKWCILCCAVQALLGLEFIPAVTAFALPWKWPVDSEWWVWVMVLLSPGMLWIFLKPLIIQAQQLRLLRLQARKFKYNAELFDELLNSHPRYAAPDENWSIVLGNPDANNRITVVTNPYCPPCAKTHQQVDELLTRCYDIQVRIVFTTNNSDEDIKTPVSRHLMALNELQDKTIVKQAIRDWYRQKQKDYKAWAKVYPVELNDANYYKLDRQKAWCQRMKVAVTPTLLLNGYRLPDFYQLSDLKYMLG